MLSLEHTEMRLLLVEEGKEEWTQKHICRRKEDKPAFISVEREVLASGQLTALAGMGFFSLSFNLLLATPLEK